MTLNLRNPYPLNCSLRFLVEECLAVSTFIFLFLLVFQPFGLSELHAGIFSAALGYGITCLVVMLLLNTAAYFNFFNYFNEEKWTLGRALFWSILNISFIGIANALYSAFIGIGDFSFLDILRFVFYTLALGIFPVGTGLLLNQIRLKNKFAKESEIINSEFIHINNHTPVTKNTRTANTNSQITIYAENGKPGLTLFPDELLFIRSTDNYVEVFYQVKNENNRLLIRNSLKNISNALSEDKQFFRCHKSYLVNMKKVVHVSGNAQGYKLHLSGTDELIPVSRAMNESVKKQLAIHP
jgi:hypothetical protein